MPSGAKNYTFTIYHDQMLDFDPVLMVYLCYQREKCPTTERLHWQCYFSLQAKKTMVWLQKYVKDRLGIGCTFIAAKGSALENRTYCSKPESAIPDTFREFGNIADIKGQGKRTDLNDCINDIKKGTKRKEIATDHTAVYIKYHQGIDKVIRLLEVLPKEPPRCFLIYGSTYTGKSFFAENMCRDPITGEDSCFTMDMGKEPWFDLYNGQRVIQIEEYEGQWNLAWLKQFLSNRKCPLRVKGSFCNNLAKVIVITSNINPRMWYKPISSENWDALMRRFDAVVEVTANEDITYKHGKIQPRYKTATWKNDSRIYNDPDFQNFLKKDMLQVGDVVL